MTDHTKEELYALGEEVGLRNGGLISLFRSHGIHGKFDSDLWDKYKKVVDYFKENCFCKICGKRFVIDLDFTVGKDHMRCPENKRHTYIEHWAGVFCKLQGKTHEEMMEEMQGKTCKHDVRIAYCDECINELKVLKFQAIMAEPNPTNYGYAEDEK